MTATVTDLSTIPSQDVKGKRFRCVPDPERSGDTTSGGADVYYISRETWPMEVTINWWSPGSNGGRGDNSVTSVGTGETWYMPNRGLRPYVEPGLLMMTEEAGYSAVLVTKQHEAWHLTRRPDGGWRTAFSFNPGSVLPYQWTDLRYLTREGLQALAADIGLGSWHLDTGEASSGSVEDLTDEEKELRSLVGKAVRLNDGQYELYGCPEGTVMYVAGEDEPILFSTSVGGMIMLLTKDRDEARTLTRADHSPSRGVIWVKRSHFEVVEESEAVPTTRTAEEIRLAEEVERLNALLRSELSRANRAESKIEEITDRLIEEADSRGWCSEYDDIASELGLRAREREYTVTSRVVVEVETTVTASDEDSAEEYGDREAVEALESALSDTYNVSVGSVEGTSEVVEN